MANLEAPVQGNINISNVQGNYLEVPMEFSANSIPINLTEFADIRMEIKNSYNVNETAFLVFTILNGLIISGTNNNILTFILDEVFWNTQKQYMVYDIVFETTEGRRYTYIKGQISNVLTASKT